MAKLWEDFMEEVAFELGLMSNQYGKKEGK